MSFAKLNDSWPTRESRQWHKGIVAVSPHELMEVNHNNIVPYKYNKILKFKS